MGRWHPGLDVVAGRPPVRPPAGQGTTGWSVDSNATTTGAPDIRCPGRAVCGDPRKLRYDEPSRLGATEGSGVRRPAQIARLAAVARSKRSQLARPAATGPRSACCESTSAIAPRASTPTSSSFQPTVVGTSAGPNTRTLGPAPDTTA